MQELLRLVILFKFVKDVAVFNLVLKKYSRSIKDRFSTFY